MIAADVQLLRHVGFSSIPEKRRCLLKYLLNNGGVMSSALVEEKLGVSLPTAHRRMRELAATGIANYELNTRVIVDKLANGTTITIPPGNIIKVADD